METITNEEYYAVRGNINGKITYFDYDAQHYDFPIPLSRACYESKAAAIHAMENYIQPYLPNIKLEIVKVTEQYKITKR